MAVKQNNGYSNDDRGCSNDEKDVILSAIWWQGFLLSGFTTPHMKIRSILPGIILLILAVYSGITVYQDFGIAWDEPIQREIGWVNYSYIFHNDPTLHHYADKDHGVGFEMPLIFLEKALDISDPREVFLMRHLVAHLFFLMGCFLFYLLAQRLFQNQWLSVLAFLMLLLHPRLYGHSFINTKDIPLLATFILSLLLADIAFEQKRVRWWLFLGLSVGYATSIRILGIVPGAAFTALLILDIFLARNTSKEATHLLICLFTYIGSFCMALYLCWPTLWEHPISAFLESFQTLAHFRWDNEVLFQGKIYNATQLPISYLPVWIGISTPVLWLVTGILGSLLVAWQLLRRPLAYFTDLPKRTILICWYCTVAPLAMIWILRSVVYDDWRHVYFIYPTFILLGLSFIQRLSKRFVMPMVVTLMLVQTGISMYDIIKLHPFPHVYFNRIISHKPGYIKRNYEQDYWGTGYKQALEYLIEKTKDTQITVAWGLSPLTYNKDMLQVQDRDRIVFQNESKAAYYITTFRAHPGEHPFKEVFYEINRQNSPVVRIYKLR